MKISHIHIPLFPVSRLSVLLLQMSAPSSSPSLSSSALSPVVLVVDVCYHLGGHDDTLHRMKSETDAYRAAIYAWLTGWGIADATTSVAEKKAREEKQYGIKSVRGFISEMVADQHNSNRMHSVLRSRYWEELAGTDKLSKILSKGSTSLPILQIICALYNEPTQLDKELRKALGVLDLAGLQSLYRSIREKRDVFNHRHQDYSIVCLVDELAFSTS